MSGFLHILIYAHNHLCSTYRGLWELVHGCPAVVAQWPVQYIYTHVNSQRSNLAFHAPNGSAAIQYTRISITYSAVTYQSSTWTYKEILSCIVSRYTNRSRGLHYILNCLSCIIALSCNVLPKVLYCCLCKLALNCCSTCTLALRLL